MSAPSTTLLPVSPSDTLMPYISSQPSTSGDSQTPQLPQKATKNRAETVEEPVARKRQKLQIEHQRMLTLEATKLEKKRDARGPGGFSYRCLTCNKVIYMRIKAVSHASKCGQKSTAKKPIKRKKQLPCNVCGETLATLKAMKLHRRQKHPNLIQKKRCTCCMKMFASYYNYKRHIVRRKSSVSFKCATCSKVFSTPTNLRRHVKDSHQPAVPALDRGQPEIDEKIRRLSRSKDLPETVRGRNQTIIVFTERLLQRARELGESKNRIEEIKQIQLRKLILPVTPLQSQPGQLTPTSILSSSRAARSEHAPQKSIQPHQYFLREPSSMSYRESSITTAGSTPTVSSGQTLAFSSTSTVGVVFSTSSPPLDTEGNTGGLLLPASCNVSSEQPVFPSFP